MICPHCLVSFHDNERRVLIDVDKDGGWVVARHHCPACNRLVLFLLNGTPLQLVGGQFHGLGKPVKSRRLFYPKGSSRAPVPSEVPAHIAEDYNEAAAVLADSAKASAALSRRGLQTVLREAGGVTPGDLAGEIQQVLDSGKLPTHLADVIDAVRNIGNFSAHPIKSKHTGEIVPVEPQEADWNLEVLDAVFDFYYVQPARIAAKKAALNQKLQQAGKPPMK